MITQFSREFSVILLHMLLCIISFQNLLGSNESAKSASFIFLELDKLTRRKFLFISITYHSKNCIHFFMEFFTIFFFLFSFDNSLRFQLFRSYQFCITLHKLKLFFDPNSIDIHGYESQICQASLYSLFS